MGKVTSVGLVLAGMVALLACVAWSAPQDGIVWTASGPPVHRMDVSTTSPVRSTILYAPMDPNFDRRMVHIVPQGPVRYFMQYTDGALR